MSEGRVRIGEMSRRLGVSTQVLRAWERRYGLLTPERSESGYRLYSAEDERRVRTLMRHLDDGLSTAEAARLALLAPTAPTVVPAAEASDALSRVRAALLASLLGADEAAAQASLDELFAITDLDGALVGVIMPVLGEIGVLWSAGRISIAVEHYATNILQSRLMTLARGWGDGTGPQTILACLPGERHCLGLIAFGLLLRRRGWRIVFLGPDMPLGSVIEWVDELTPAAVVAASVSASRFEQAADELRPLAGRVRLLLGGAGASPAIAARVGATACSPDMVLSADALSRAVGV